MINCKNVIYIFVLTMIILIQCESRSEQSGSKTIEFNLDEIVKQLGGAEFDKFDSYKISYSKKNAKAKGKAFPRTIEGNIKFPAYFMLDSTFGIYEKNRVILALCDDKSWSKLNEDAAEDSSKSMHDDNKRFINILGIWLQSSYFIKKLLAQYKTKIEEDDKNIIIHSDNPFVRKAYFSKPALNLSKVCGTTFNNEEFEITLDDFKQIEKVKVAHKLSFATNGKLKDVVIGPDGKVLTFTVNAEPKETVYELLEIEFITLKEEFFKKP
jgi:hypothetical protein